MRPIASVIAVSLALAAFGASAQAVRTERNISAGLASQIAVEAVNACNANGYAVAATVVDRAGVVRAVVRGDNADPLGTMGGGDNGGRRYAIELYAQAYNALNHLNAVNFSGVVGSPFFGTATSAAPPRRVELGARLNF